jgi:hypothetical protein
LGAGPGPDTEAATTGVKLAQEITKPKNRFRKDRVKKLFIK